MNDAPSRHACAEPKLPNSDLKKSRICPIYGKSDPRLGQNLTPPAPSYLFDDGQGFVSVQNNHLVRKLHLLGALPHEVLVRSVVLNQVPQSDAV